MLLPLAAPLDPLPLAVCFWKTADEASSMAHAVCFSFPSRSTTCLSVRPLSLLSCVANGSHDTLSSTRGAVDAAAAAVVAVVGTLAALAFCFDKGTTKHDAIIFVLPQVKEHDPSAPETTPRSHCILLSSFHRLPSCRSPSYDMIDPDAMVTPAPSDRSRSHPHLGGHLPEIFSISKNSVCDVSETNKRRLKSQLISTREINNLGRAFIFNLLLLNHR